MPRTLSIARTVLPATAAVFAMLAGCGRPTSSSGPETSPGVLPPPDPDDAAQLAAANDSHEPPPSRRPRTQTAIQEAGDAALGITRTPEGPSSGAPSVAASAAEAAVGSGDSPAGPAPTAADQISANAQELRRLLRQNVSMSAPLSAELAVAALDAFVADPPSATGAVPAAPLSRAEQAVEQSARDLFGGLADQARNGASPARVADLLAAAADALASHTPVRISFAGLCRRVDSFGSYEPFESMAFLAGRTHRAIVYVELDRFAYRSPSSADGSASTAGRWVVELSQELELIHDADGRQQWYRPPQTVIDASRTRRRDFYLVNTIDLPATLSVGAYSLKVTIRDKTTGAADERVIPLQVIADASAVLSPRSAAAKK